MNRKEKNFWIDHYKQLIGKTVKEVLIDSEAEVFGIGFTDGTEAMVLCDPEGNGPGFLDIQKPGANENDN